MIIKGDLEGNGRISVLSRAIVFLYSESLVANLTDEQKTAADVNDDGVIDKNDADDIRDHLNGSVIISEVVY